MGFDQFIGIALSWYSFVSVGTIMVIASYLQPFGAKHPIQTRLERCGGFFLILFGLIQIAMPAGRVQFAIIFSVTMVHLVWQSEQVKQLRESKKTNEDDLA